MKVEYCPKYLLMEIIIEHTDLDADDRDLCHDAAVQLYKYAKESAPMIVFLEQTDFFVIINKEDTEEEIYDKIISLLVG